MSVYARPPAGAYLPQQTYALPAQQPPPSDVRPPGCAPASSSHSPNFTLPPGVPLQANPRDLIAELCQIIQRQSQEILAMRQERFQERGAQATGFVERRLSVGRSAAVALGPASAATCPVASAGELPRIHGRFPRACTNLCSPLRR